MEAADTSAQNNHNDTHQEGQAQKDHDAIKKQVEYYLSDDNLKHDKFFYDEITKDQEGYLDLNLLLNCKKLQELNATKEDIIDALKESEQLEFSDKLIGLRRKNNTPLPVFEGRRKKMKTENEERRENKNNNLEQDVEPIIMTIRLKDKDEAKANWFAIGDAIQHKFSVKPIYVRFNQAEGNLAFDKKHTTDEVINEVTSNELQIEDDVFTINKTVGDELKEFYKLHGNHFTRIIGTESKLKKKKKKDSFINVGTQTFRDISKLRNHVKDILARTPNDQPVTASEGELLKELLGHHDKKDEKLRDLKEFTVGTHPKYPQTRCFFIVKNDDTKEDFSIHKCIDNFDIKN